MNINRYKLVTYITRLSELNDSNLDDFSAVNTL